MRLKLASGREEFWIEFPEGASVNVAQSLQSVKEKRPAVYQRWCDGEGQLRASLAVFVNREHVRYHRGMDTELNDGDEVYVIPLSAGG
jgi:molybdopterin synthase sulfur carrier subunit